MGELIGIVKDYEYLCACATCNFSKILRAHEFEEHFGGKTRHPNNYIYLENGKPTYSIIQEMKTAPFNVVDEVIKEVASSSVNEEFLQVWKAAPVTQQKTVLAQTYIIVRVSSEPQTYVKKTEKEHKYPPKKYDRLNSAPIYSVVSSFSHAPPVCFINVMHILQIKSIPF